MTSFENLEALLEDQLKDIYSAEKQLVKALPRVADASNSNALRSAIQSHLKETEGHIKRLEQIADRFEFKLSGKKCKGMEGLIDEGKEALQSDGLAPLTDQAIIAAAQRVEHYEIAAYGTARTLAERLNLDEAVDLLQATLDEERAADIKLTSISEEQILANFPSDAEEETDEEDEEESMRGLKGSRTRRSESRL